MNKLKHMKCKNCGYEWDSKSEMIWVTCPSCRYKSAMAKKEGEDKDE